MSDEKLTVAELLARAKQEGSTSSSSDQAPRRRRRRSLEDGGISVAELTGSIPKVRAEGPRRGSHALVDEEGASDSRNTVADTVEAVEQRSADEQPEVEPVAEPVAVAEPAVRETPAAPAVAVPLAVPTEPVAVTQDSARGEVTYTFTELRDPTDPSRTVAEAGPVARDVLAWRDGAPTGVAAGAPKAKLVATSAPAPETTLERNETSPQDLEATATLPIVSDEKSKAEESNAQAARVAEENTKRDELDAPEELDTVEKDSDTDTLADRDYPAPTEQQLERADERGDEVAEREVAEEPVAKKAAEDPAEDNSLSIGLLIVQVIVGLLAGVLVFFAFILLWESLPTAAVIFLALLVIALFIGGANLIRRKRDVLTPILAGLVGIALTFGPLALNI